MRKLKFILSLLCLCYFSLFSEDMENQITIQSMELNLTQNQSTETMNISNNNFMNSNQISNYTNQLSMNAKNYLTQAKTQLNLLKQELEISKNQLTISNLQLMNMTEFLNNCQMNLDNCKKALESNKEDTSEIINELGYLQEEIDNYKRMIRKLEIENKVFKSTTIFLGITTVLSTSYFIYLLNK